MACSCCGKKDHNIQTCEEVKPCSFCGKKNHTRKKCPEIESISSKKDKVVDDLGAYRVSDIRYNEEIISKIAKIVRWNNEQVRDLLQRSHGSMYVESAFFDYWPEDDICESIENDNDESMEFEWRFLQPSGVKEKIINELLNFKQLRNSEAIWITFSFNFPGDEIVEIFKENNVKLSVLCCEPNTVIGREGVSISRNDFDKWMGVGFPPLRYLDTDKEVDGSEASPIKFGKLHGKALVLFHEGKAIGAVGSFNLARNSLSENTESIVFIKGEDAIKLWEEAEFLLKNATEVTGDHCHEYNAKELKIISPPKDMGAKIIKGSNKKISFKCRPESLAWLKHAIHDLMLNWPVQAEHKKRGWQYEAYEDFKKQIQGLRADVLYLPVGLGKTFIALRWLLDQFDEHLVDQGKQGVFLVHSEWIEQSVKADIKKIINAAVIIGRKEGRENSKQLVEEIARQCLFVTRPNGLSKIDSRNVVALVADECHHWSPYRKDAPIKQYQGQLERYRKNQATKIIGLTATPCRMDHMKFDVGGFLKEFRISINKSHAVSNDASPLMRLSDAVNDGLLSSFETFLLLEHTAQKKITNILDNAVVRMGDYSEVALRDVWRLLMNYQSDLIREIVSNIEDNCKRALVFMPPVASEGDQFVKLLGREVKKLKGSFFDFRLRAPNNANDGLAAAEVFESFRDSDRFPTVLVTVDRFAEGVSINDIDTLVMLRATLSPLVAVQALGRGLRLDPRNPGKICRILDGVGFMERLNNWEGLA